MATTLKEEVERLRDLDVNDLIVLNKAVIQLINEKRAQRDMAKAATLYPGMNVQFTHKGIRHEGTITKINVKSCGVNVTSPAHLAGPAKVSINMLEVI